MLILISLVQLLGASYCLITALKWAIQYGEDHGMWMVAVDKKGKSPPTKSRLRKSMLLITVAAVLYTGAAGVLAVTTYDWYHKNRGEERPGALLEKVEAERLHEEKRAEPSPLPGEVVDDELFRQPAAKGYYEPLGMGSDIPSQPIDKKRIP